MKYIKYVYYAPVICKIEILETQRKRNSVYSQGAPILMKIDKRQLHVQTLRYTGRCTRSYCAALRGGKGQLGAERAASPWGRGSCWVDVLGRERTADRQLRQEEGPLSACRPKRKGTRDGSGGKRQLDAGPSNWVSVSC